MVVFCREPKRDERGCVYFADLKATVHCERVDEALASELPERYGSCFSVREYFDLYDRPTTVCACELEAPRHVLLLAKQGHTVDVLNKLIDIDPPDVDRLKAAVLRAFPDVRRIRAEVKFPPELATGPLRVRVQADDYVIDLPGSLEEYRQSLGKRTRQNLNKYTNRLARLYPDFRLETLEREAVSLDLVSKTVKWNILRLHAKGEVSVFERFPEKVPLLWRLLQSYGVALCGYDGDRCVAAQLILHVGRDWWVHTAGFCRDYEDVHLGLLMGYFTVGEGIDRGCRRMHLTWTTPVYKQRLGAVAVPAWQVSLFRSAPHKLLYAREAWHDDEWSRIYWRWRKRAKRAVTGLSDVRRVAGTDRDRHA